MGFGFNLIGFPLLLVATAGVIIYAIAKKTWKPLLVVAALWGLAVLAFIAASVSNHYRSSIRLTKNDIVGNYRIDTNFYSGKNARWQYDHYKFTITSTDSLFFYVTNKDTILKTIKVKLKYSSGPPDLWVIKSDPTYHVIENPPILYRSHNKFYYVLHSDLYGNMFFRKVENN